MSQPPTLAQDIQQIEAAHSSGFYSKRPLTLVRGAGSTVWDDAGNAYLDCTSGMGVALLGHAHPAVAAAVAQQAQTLITCPEIFYNDRRAELYTRLQRLLPEGLDRFFLCNSGAEAVEGALKVARLLTGRRGIIAVKRSFHGRTLGALATTWNPQYRAPFEGWTPTDVQFISPNDAEELRQAITSESAAVIVEAVQGEGGVYPLDPAYLQTLRQRCTETGTLLILDEIQAGLGRTGRWFGFQYADIAPDIVTLGKGIAGGVPMGVVIWRSALGTVESGTHGSTFGGNPLAAAAAVAALDTLISIDAPTRSAELGTWLLDELRARNLPGVRELRGQGLLVGLELRGRVTPVIQALQARGVLALVAGKTVLRLLPPLIIEREELRRVVDAVEEALRDARN